MRNIKSASGTNFPINNNTSTTCNTITTVSPSAHSGSLLVTSPTTLSINSALGSPFAYPVTYNTSTQEEIEVLGKKISGYYTFEQRLIFAQLNFFGIDFYNELKKVGITISDPKLEKHLESQLKTFNRDKKIKNVIEHS